MTSAYPESPPAKQQTAAHKQPIPIRRGMDVSKDTPAAPLSSVAPASRLLFPAGEEAHMPSTRKAAARRNVRKAASAARRKRTIAHLPKKTRTALAKKGAAAARKKRGG
jgi:hypothetical protein